MAKGQVTNFDQCMKILQSAHKYSQILFGKVSSMISVQLNAVINSFPFFFLLCENIWVL